MSSCWARSDFLQALKDVRVAILQATPKVARLSRGHAPGTQQTTKDQHTGSCLSGALASACLAAVRLQRSLGHAQACCWCLGGNSVTSAVLPCVLGRAAHGRGAGTGGLRRLILLTMSRFGMRFAGASYHPTFNARRLAVLRPLSVGGRRHGISQSSRGDGATSK